MGYTIFMSGHSKWSQIKHKKGVTDQKRGAQFSKLLVAITAAARNEPNPDFNPRLRTAVEKARGAQVPGENIQRAIKRASEAGGAVIEELVLEAYGPGGAAIIMEATTDNKNRTIPEVKKILGDAGGKWAESGSVRWAFEFIPELGWRAKFPQKISAADSDRLRALVEALEEHPDVQAVRTSSAQA